jgi:hypothetical protein
MSRYYPNSKFFSWLRNSVFKLDKPYALPWGGWDKWEIETRQARPWAYFFCETLPEILEKPAEWFVDPLYNARYYLRNRFVSKTHYLKTKLEPGQYYEFEKRILHGLFTELVDFVEIEQASHHVAWDEEAREKFKTPWHQQHRLFRIAEWRCPEAGIAYLQWAMDLDEPDHQRESAREIMILYTWWQEVYLKRQDPWLETGFRAFWDSMEAKYGDNWLGIGQRSKLTKTERAEYDRLHKAVDDLEQARELEEEEMMIRLVKLRKALWT